MTLQETIGESDSGVPLTNRDEIDECIAGGRLVVLCHTTEQAAMLGDLGVPSCAPSIPLIEFTDHVTDILNFFADADLVILQDGDEFWRRYSENLSRLMYGNAKRIRLMAAVENYASAEIFFETLRKVPDVVGVVSDEPNISPFDRRSDMTDGLLDESKEPEQTKSNFGAIFFNDIGVGKVQYHWVVKGVIPAGQVVITFGDSGSGKSFDTIDMDICIARGKFFGPYRTKRGLCIYVAAEAQVGFGKRVAGYRKEHQIADDEEVPFVLLTKKPTIFKDEKEIDRLIQECLFIAKYFPELKLVKITIDTISAVSEGMNENASESVSIMRARLDKLKDATGATVHAIHHKPKGLHGVGPRGHGSWTADVETTIEYDKDDQHVGLGPPMHTAIVRKQREGESGLKWQFTLPKIELGIDDDGDKITTCVKKWETDRADLNSSAKRMSAKRLYILRNLISYVDDHGRDSLEHVKGLPPGRKMVELKLWREHLRETTIAGSHETDKTKVVDSLRHAINNAIPVFTNEGYMGMFNETPEQGGRSWIWWTGKSTEGGFAARRRADQALAEGPPDDDTPPPGDGDLPL